MHLSYIYYNFKSSHHCWRLQIIADNTQNCSVTSALWSADAGNCDQLYEITPAIACFKGYLVSLSIVFRFTKPRLRERVNLFSPHIEKKKPEKRKLRSLYHGKMDCLN